MGTWGSPHFSLRPTLRGRLSSGVAADSQHGAIGACEGLQLFQGNLGMGTTPSAPAAGQGFFRLGRAMQETGVQRPLLVQAQQCWGVPRRPSCHPSSERHLQQEEEEEGQTDEEEQGETCHPPSPPLPPGRVMLLANAASLSCSTSRHWLKARPPHQHWGAVSAKHACLGQQG